MKRRSELRGCCREEGSSREGSKRTALRQGYASSVLELEENSSADAAEYARNRVADSRRQSQLLRAHTRQNTRTQEGGYFP